MSASSGWPPGRFAGTNLPVTATSRVLRIAWTPRDPEFARYARTTSRAFSGMRNVSTGVLGPNGLRWRRLKSGSSEGSQPPHATSAGCLDENASTARWSAGVCGSLTALETSSRNMAGPTFSESTSSRPNAATDGVPSPAEPRRPLLIDFRLTGRSQATTAITAPANTRAGADGGVLRVSWDELIRCYKVLICGPRSARSRWQVSPTDVPGNCSLQPSSIAQERRENHRV